MRFALRKNAPEFRAKSKCFTRQDTLYLRKIVKIIQILLLAIKRAIWRINLQNKAANLNFKTSPKINLNFNLFLATI